MQRFTLVGLVLLNVALVAVLALVTFGNPTTAFAWGGTARGEYVAISGTISGTKTPVIWIVNQATQEVVSLQFDSQKDQLIGYGYRNMNDDAVSIKRSRQ